MQTNTKILKYETTYTQYIKHLHSEIQISGDIHDHTIHKNQPGLATL
jgi:hypothetical protein